ncbi:acyl-CoA reductase [Sphingobacterium paludis]|uniref:Acyl-CoA reductase LuxC n=1 Tax=Sphingobacterium paludis TaxID=1476465 RepID=A0A4R7DCR3_9SPHI|nr:acyl-CoA reductase [Sphingobacterium paludis]TDS17724.1 acyl-CoA reductase LuxC [Sphingobacterium paludis]
MTKKQRIEAFAALGRLLQTGGAGLEEILQSAAIKNPWYTVPNTRKQIAALTANLQESTLAEWLAPYPDLESDKTVGLILAGNIPLVGFQDIMSVLLAGFHAKIKLSSDDAGLTPFIVNALNGIEPRFASKITIVDRLADYDLVIATGSDNSSRYFEHYFGKKPHIIRKNRNAVAILTGEESTAELQHLGYDIFDYFGLGCRSVSKMFIPEDFPLSRFFEAIASFEPIREHFKYGNNYDYNKSIYLINGDKHFDNGFLLVKEDQRIASPLAVLFYETYSKLEDVTKLLDEQAEKIQCIVSNGAIESKISTFSLGGSQCPGLTDYADGVDVPAFLFTHA